MKQIKFTLKLAMVVLEKAPNFDPETLKALFIALNVKSTVLADVRAAIASIRGSIRKAGSAIQGINQAEGVADANAEKQIKQIKDMREKQKAVSQELIAQHKNVIQGGDDQIEKLEKIAEAFAFLFPDNKS